MPFYIRKSLRFGPLRFNLSKSGIGVSAGVKGLRIGSGPRGNYVHMGRGGLYYRASLSSPQTSSPARHSPAPAPTKSVERDIAMQGIDSASSAQIVDSSSLALVQELRQKQKKFRLARIATFVTGFLTLIGFSAGRPNLGPVLLILTVTLYFLLRIYDSRRKTTVIFYDLAEDAEERFRRVYDAFARVASAKKIWHIPSKGSVANAKYHAGANTVVERAAIKVGFRNPPFVCTNVPTPSLPVGTQTLFFFPDRVLVFDSQSVGGISYDSLLISTEATRFIEDESVPSDARIVGKTWRYVNKSGGPDRRFNNNREIPIAEYEAAHLTSPSGINEMLYVSKTGSFSMASAAIHDAGDYIKSCTAPADAADMPSTVMEDSVVSESSPSSALVLPFSCLALGLAFLVVFGVTLGSGGKAPPESAASVTVAAPPAKPAPIVPPAATAQNKPEASTMFQPASKTAAPEPKPLGRFSANTPVPATLILQGSLVLKSKEHGVTGLGRGQQITVISRTDSQLTVQTDRKQFVVESSLLESALVERSTSAPIHDGSQHLPPLTQILASLQTFEWGRLVRQIPATVIDNGVLRYVPYTSYRVGEKFEVNVYGDPEAPIGLEIGYYDPPQNSWTEKGHCLALILANLQGLASNQRVGAINFKGDSFKIENLTFEITPPEAPDAYGGFWISLYDQASLENARATPDEVAQISVEQPSHRSTPSTPVTPATSSAPPASWTAADYAAMRPKPKAPPTTPSSQSAAYSSSSYPSSSISRVYVSGYFRKDGTYVNGHSRRK